MAALPNAERYRISRQALIVRRPITGSRMTNDSSVLYAETSTQIGNSLAVTSALTGALSARFSFDVRYDTDPPLGFEQTDTVTRIALVYAFGK